ncbi:MAG: DEAD-box ATP-dependent RNA helicase CshA [Phycisphaerae bacterium]|nr:DEAD-box ATP-dependent RNA helicase CshA [Phycisphaerae bacterium]
MTQKIRRPRSPVPPDAPDADPLTPAAEAAGPIPEAAAHAPESAGPVPTFRALGLQQSLLDGLDELGFHTPTEIQHALIPVALQGKDCIGLAKTGTGKTAAFALPILQRTAVGGGVQALVLVPTRELAMQVDEHFSQLGKRHPLKVALFYGGRRISTQVKQMEKHPEVVIGTPGRILDMMRRGNLNLGGVRIAVLDEVDRMLDIGFRDDIRRILRDISAERQTIFVSATLDEEIRKLAKSFMREPVEVNVSRDVLTVESIEQGFVTVDPHDKFPTLLGFLKHENPTLAIVFTNTKAGAQRIGKRLKEAGVKCKEIHGDLMQNRRERVMESFRTAQIQVLVATDLASRGIDVMEVSHIVNYDVPQDPSVYVHRVGRTARMGRSGFAVTLVSPDQGKMLTAIEMHINKELPRLEGPWVVRRDHAHREHGERGHGRRAPDHKPRGDEAGALLPAAEPEAARAGSRLTEALRRDDVFESLGLRPIRRTLGSRFRSSKRLRRFP